MRSVRRDPANSRSCILNTGIKRVDSTAHKDAAAAAKYKNSATALSLRGPRNAVMFLISVISVPLCEILYTLCSVLSLITARSAHAVHSG